MYYVGHKTLSIYLTKAIRCDIINVLFKMQVNFMSSNDTVLKRDEEYVLGLRSLYESYGYKKFKMRKFEKYDLYLENKSFLRNGGIITVTDPKGRLLALKPDITLSIVKNILDMHRGRYGVMSQVGVGSTFWFELQTAEPTKAEAE